MEITSTRLAPVKPISEPIKAKVGTIQYFEQTQNSPFGKITTNIKKIEFSPKSFFKKANVDTCLLHTTPLKNGTTLKMIELYKGKDMVLREILDSEGNKAMKYAISLLKKLAR